MLGLFAGTEPEQKFINCSQVDIVTYQDGVRFYAKLLANTKCKGR